MSGHYRKGVLYHPNQWTPRKLRELKRLLGGCQAPGCSTTDPSCLDFAHLKDTPILKSVRGRGRKERLQDIMRHPEAYTLLCDGGAGGHHTYFDKAREDGVELAWQPKNLLEIAQARELNLF